MPDSNTATNTRRPNPVKNSKPFQRGDKRINRKGRPVSFDAMRARAQKIAMEMVDDPDHSGKRQERLTRCLRRMAESAQHVQSFLEIAYGKVPTNIDVTTGGEKIKGYIGISPEDWNDSAEAQAD